MVARELLPEPVQDPRHWKYYVSLGTRLKKFKADNPTAIKMKDYRHKIMAEYKVCSSRAHVIITRSKPNMVRFNKRVVYVIL
jgi:hypothetical protein